MNFNISKIVVVVVVISLLIWFGTMLVGAAENLEQASHSRMAKIDSILENN